MSTMSVKGSSGIVSPPPASQPIVDSNIRSTSLRDKLAPYDQMPPGSVAFLLRSIDLLREVLQRKDEASPLSEKKLQIFNEQLEHFQQEVFQKVLMAAIRACIFSNSEKVPDFLQRHKESGLGDEPRSENHRQSVATCVNYETKILALRKVFSSLPEGDQERIIDEFDPFDIDQLDLTPEGKKILRDISAFSIALVQNNPLFDEAFRTVASLLAMQEKE